MHQTPKPSRTATSWKKGAVHRAGSPAARAGRAGCPLHRTEPAALPEAAIPASLAASLSSYRRGLFLSGRVSEWAVVAGSWLSLRQQSSRPSGAEPGERPAAPPGPGGKLRSSRTVGGAPVRAAALARVPGNAHSGARPGTGGVSKRAAGSRPDSCRRRQGERSRARSPRSAACAATPAHGRSGDSGTAPSRGSAWERKAHKPGAGLEAAPLRRGPWRAPASSGFGWRSRSAPLRSAGVREGSGQVAPRPTHVAILFSRASPGLLALPFAPAVAVVRGKQGTDGPAADGTGSPCPPTAGREESAKPEIRERCGAALGHLPQRLAQRGPAAGGCSAAGLVPQTRRRWSGSGGRRSGGALVPAIRLPPRPPPLPRPGPAPAAQHSSVTDTAWGGVCSAMGGRGEGEAGGPGPGALLRSGGSALALWSPPPAVRESPAGRQNPHPGGRALAAEQSCGLGERGLLRSELPPRWQSRTGGS